ncbi:MAG: AHH domain-containing protein [Bacteroidales bacterium]|nr:AHH domain-containing protein [Clostridium sp.]MCM1203863.1 AHH domain-containing protein [Bacteroidales bacterium]
MVGLTDAQTYAELVASKTKVYGIYSDSLSASDILRQELYSAGVAGPPYQNAAHHIVPWNDTRAKTAREILERFDIELDSAALYRNLKRCFLI